MKVLEWKDSMRILQGSVKSGLYKFYTVSTTRLLLVQEFDYGLYKV